MEENSESQHHFEDGNLETANKEELEEAGDNGDAVHLSSSPKLSLQLDGQDVIRAGTEILFQAFNWESHKHDWWKNLASKIQEISATGFTALWLPPSSESLAPEGYMPRDYYKLNTAYGTEDDLRRLLGFIKQNNMKPMADLVINHRIGSTKGFNGTYNRYDGTSMPWDEHAVTCDSGGLGNPATGAIFDGAPNIDHTQEFVRRDLKEWMRWLINDVGYDSFRFDFAKGYGACYVKEYIEASHPVFAVGSFGIRTAIDKGLLIGLMGPAVLAALLTLRPKPSFRNKEWWRLKDPNGRPPGVMGMWPSRAVTFIDNHDTGSTQAHWPFPSEHILQGYAYILTHPGQPSVFYDHFFDWGEDIRNAISILVQIRKRNRLHSRSSVRIYEANDNVYAACVDDKLSMKIGDGNWDAGWGWQLATSGQSYAVWERKN